MALRDRINKFQKVATATLATPATPNKKEQRSVATVAKVAVAESEKTKSIRSTVATVATVATQNREKDFEHRKPETDSRGVATATIATPATHQKERIPAWLDAHREKLTAAGFTEKDLFNTSLPKGIAHMDIWKRRELSVELQGNALLFGYRSATGKHIIQTARPEGIGQRRVVQ